MASHVVIGGGVNGLSVAGALAESGADVLVLDKGRIGSGVGHRRRDCAQLLPRGGDHRAGAPVGGDLRGGPRGLRLSPGGLPGGGSRGAGGRPGGDPRATRAHRLRVRAGHGRRGLPRVPHLELARLGRSGGGAAARAPWRLGRRDADGAPAGRTGARCGSRDPRRSRGGGLRAGRERGGGGDHLRRRTRRVRDAGAGPRPVGGAALAAAGTGPARRGGRCAAPAGRVPEGPGGRVRPWRSGSLRARGQRGAGGAPRPGGTAALGSRRQRSGGRAVGHLLPHGANGYGDHRRRAARAARGPGPRSLRARQPRARRRAGLPRLLHLRAGHGAAALSRTGRRLEADRGGRHRGPHPDNYPVCDWVLDNVYAIVDSGHGFKALAVGRLAAQDIANSGEEHLESFRLDRFARGALHAASKGPYPWT